MRPRIGPFATTDVLLAAAFAVAAALEAVLRSKGHPAALALGLGGALAMAVLLVRRRRPLLAMLLFCVSGAGATLVQSKLLDAPDDAFVPNLTLIVLSFALGAYAGPRDLLLGAPQPVALVVLVDLMEPGQSVAGAIVFVTVFVVVLPVVAGRLVRSRRNLVRELRDLERIAAREHDDRLRTVRVEESLAVTEMLNRTLEAGLEQLLVADDIGEVEHQARTLLATTRDTVVGLAREQGDLPLTTATPGPRRSPPGPDSGAEVPAFTWASIVAAGLGAGFLTEAGPHWSHPVAGLALTGVLVAGVMSMTRRPLTGALLVWATATLLSRTVAPLGDTFTGIGLTVVVPFLACWLADRRRAAIAVVAGLVAAVSGLQMSDPLGATVLTSLATVAGGILRDRSTLLAEVRAARAVAADRRRDELRVAALEERAAMGRELHDSIGHALTVVALQAGAARRLQSTDPVAAAGAREAIERTARQALDDLRRGFETEPGVIADLLATARAAGLEISVVGPSPPAHLLPVVHRVLQEALTNVLRHAPGARTEVRLATSGDREAGYACTITNAAVGPPDEREPRPAYPSAGHGLVGMRARVEDAGGTVTWRPVDGGFQVSATFPSRVEVST
jgi:signal transduction histidine kinase